MTIFVRLLSVAQTLDDCRGDFVSVRALLAKICCLFLRSLGGQWQDAPLSLWCSDTWLCKADDCTICTWSDSEYLTFGVGIVFPICGPNVFSQMDQCVLCRLQVR